MTANIQTKQFYVLKKKIDKRLFYKVNQSMPYDITTQTPKYSMGFFSFFKREQQARGPIHLIIRAVHHRDS